MKLFLLECNAEELKANRTVMDSINETLSNFTRAFCGANVDITKCYFEDKTEDETESREEE